MSNYWPPRFSPNQRGQFRGSNPRFPQLNQPPVEGFRPRHGNFASRGYIPPRQEFQPRNRYPNPYRGYRPNFEFRGRGRGGRGGHGRGGFSDGQGKGIEAYYKHSMVEDPWQELEQQQQQTQQLGNQ